MIRPLLIMQRYLGGSQSYTWGRPSNGDANPYSGKHDMWHNHLPGTDVVSQIFYSTQFYTSYVSTGMMNRTALHHTAPHRTALHRTAPCWLKGDEIAAAVECHGTHGVCIATHRYLAFFSNQPYCHACLVRIYMCCGYVYIRPSIKSRPETFRNLFGSTSHTKQCTFVHLASTRAVFCVPRALDRRR